MTKKLIMFEGIDCCGKDTQIEMLTEYLDLKGKSYKVVNNPIEKRYRNSIKRLLEVSDEDDGGVNELLKNRAIGNIFVIDKIRSIFPGGYLNSILQPDEPTEYIIMNRFYVSLIYNFDLEQVKQITKEIKKFLKEKFDVDLIVIELRIYPETALKRLTLRTGELPDRFENRVTLRDAFDRYGNMWLSHPNRCGIIDIDSRNDLDFSDIWITIDGSPDKEFIHARVAALFDILMEKESMEKPEKHYPDHIVQIIPLTSPKMFDQGVSTFLSHEDPELVKINLDRYHPENFRLADDSLHGQVFYLDRYFVLIPENWGTGDQIVIAMHTAITGDYNTLYDALNFYSILSTVKVDFFQKTSDEFLIKLYIPWKGFSNNAAEKLRNLLQKNLEISIGDRNCELYDISSNYSIHGIYQEEVCLKDEDLTSISFKVKTMLK